MYAQNVSSHKSLKKCLWMFMVIKKHPPPLLVALWVKWVIRICLEGFCWKWYEFTLSYGVYVYVWITAASSTYRIIYYKATRNPIVEAYSVAEQ